MSSIKLKHSGGNGVIIAAPSSNPASDRTITLNDNYTGDGSFVTANSSGNVGLGTASPACNLHVSAANPRARFTSTGNTVNYDIFMGSTTATVGTSSNHATVFMTNDAERMRIDTSGHIGFGPHGIDPSSNGGITMRQTVISGTNKGAVISNNTIDSGQGFQEFRSSGTQIGSIGKSGTTSTTYNTGSDYRLKENESPITDGITRLKVLKPYRFNWKADASTRVDGFFAHEVTPAVPEAITGEKDAVDDNNNPIIQQIDQSKLVPLLTAALQEEVTKREALEARVAALEAA